jgi:N-acetylneuraminate synthase
MLEGLGCPAYKIASAEVEDLDLIRAVGRTGKPVILSDGMADVRPALRALFEAAIAANHDELDWMQLRCVSEYPARPECYRLGDLGRAVARGFEVGLSDHTLGSEVAIAAVALGACMVEKHLRLGQLAYDFADVVAPPDFGHSLNPDRFAEYVRTIRVAETMRGGGHTFGGSAWRRRVVYARDLPAGHVIAEADLRTARCGGDGPAPSAIASVCNQVTTRAVRAGEPVSWSEITWRQLVAQ